MKATELIKALQAIVDEHGDLPVCYYDEYRYLEVEDLKHKIAEKPFMQDDLPERIELE